MKKLERIATCGLNETNKLSFNNQIPNSILELELHLEGTAEVLRDVEDAVSEAKEERISPRVLTPRNFIKAPSLKEDYYFLYLRISKIDMVLVNGRLIYNIHTPIPNTGVYNVM